MRKQRPQCKYQQICLVYLYNSVTNIFHFVHSAEADAKQAVDKAKAEEAEAKAVKEAEAKAAGMYLYVV